MAAGIKGDCADRMNANAKILLFVESRDPRKKKGRKKRRGGVDSFYAYTARDFSLDNII